MVWCDRFGATGLVFRFGGAWHSGLVDRFGEDRFGEDRFGEILTLPGTKCRHRYILSKGAEKSGRKGKEHGEMPGKREPPIYLRQ